MKLILKSKLSRLRHPLVLGTMILTASGLISRLIGFFYRIYLSRLFGEESMGVYQLISPVISLAFSFCAAGYQTAVSKLSAELAAKEKASFGPGSKRPLWAAISISLPLSLLSSAITYYGAVPIGSLLLKEPRTIPLLRIIAFSFPFVGIHACINGWFYGMKKAGLPSIAQLIEQLTRVGCVYLVTAKDLAMSKTPAISTAVLGLSLGEVVSMLFALVTFLPFCAKKPAALGAYHNTPSIYPGLLATSLPLTANRLVLTFLGSAESVAIPEMLRLHGYDTQTALSVYGVLTGMALPLVFFPNALSGSMSVMLLPMISENYCLGNLEKVRSLTRQSLKYCLYLGALCFVIFSFGGRFLGRILFHSAMAGQCIQTLGFICPFLYLDTTLSGILQGLGKSGSIFSINVISLLIRLAFVYLTIPAFGIKGYLWGMLAGQLLLSTLFLALLYRTFSAKGNTNAIF